VRVISQSIFKSKFTWKIHFKNQDNRLRSGVR